MFSTTSQDSQAGQVDAGRHGAHARRAEDAERDGVSENADENDERRDKRVEILTGRQQVWLHAQLTTASAAAAHSWYKLPVARAVGPRSVVA